MTETKRNALKAKVAAGEARHKDMGRTTIVDRAGERAIEAKDKFVAFAKEHPVATVAGGIAVGVLISSLFKRSPTRKAGSKAAGLAAVGAQLAWGYAQQAIAAAQEAGRHSAERLDELGDSIGKSARTTGKDAADRAGQFAENAKSIAHDTGSRLAQALRDRRS